MAFRVIRLSWDLLPAGAHPFLRGPSTKAKQIGILLAQVPFFCTSLILMRASSQRLIAIQKKRNHLVALCFAFVIRLGFEPKTHSLEGCCSIQLSYRTDPYVFLAEKFALCPKEGAKIVIIFGYAKFT